MGGRKERWEARNGKKKRERWRREMARRRERDGEARWEDGQRERWKREMGRWREMVRKKKRR